MHPPLSTLDDDAWDDLLNYIEERRVIPIVGPGAAQGRDRDRVRACCMTGWRRSSPPSSASTPAQLPQPYTLNDVVCWFLASRGRREEAYTRLRSILRDANFAPPLALRRLAQITDFNLFVTTTFDPLLETGDQPRALRRRAIDRGHRLRAQPRRRPARRARRSCSARSSTTCSAGSRPRRPTSSPTRTCWSSSARCRAST